MSDNKTSVIARARGIIDSYQGDPIRIMEVCGTHTHEIFRLGIRGILPDNVKLISGPGCPVCVTPVDFIDQAVCLAMEHNATICTFGDLVRVPGSFGIPSSGEKGDGKTARIGSLAAARAAGARIQVVYAPQDAVAYAKEHPDEQVVFLSVGFETTTPSSCLAVQEAKSRGLTNFSILTANKTMPAAYAAMKDSTDAFLYPGHVHAITGTGICEQLAREGTSGVVAGFTAKELMTALAPWRDARIPPAAAAKYCRADACRQTAKYSGRAVHQNIPSGRAWYPARVPAPPFISTAGIADPEYWFFVPRQEPLNKI